MALATVTLHQDHVILSTSISACITEGAFSHVFIAVDCCKTFLKAAGTFFITNGYLFGVFKMNNQSEGTPARTIS